MRLICVFIALRRDNNGRESEGQIQSGNPKHWHSTHLGSVTLNPLKCYPNVYFYELRMVIPQTLGQTRSALCVILHFRYILTAEKGRKKEHKIVCVADRRVELGLDTTMLNNILLLAGESRKI